MMNSDLRKKNERALVTLYFADGGAVYEKYLQEVASMCPSITSTWQRESALHAVVNSLAHQVSIDNLSVYDILTVTMLCPCACNSPVLLRDAKQNQGEV